jgi:hypothetical protein
MAFSSFGSIHSLFRSSKVPVTYSIAGATYTATKSGQFNIITITAASNNSITINGTNKVEILVVAGGGGGGVDTGGGGGGGGVIYNTSYTITQGTPITMTVGTGGLGAAHSGFLGNSSNIGNNTGGTNTTNYRGLPGNNSVFGGLTAIGGGGGSTAANTNGGDNGGCGDDDGSVAMRG